jgi:peptide/nickel transport system permease protein
MEKIRLFKTIKQSPRWEYAKRMWYKFSRSPLSIAGLVISATCIFIGLFAPYIVPYPEHGGLFHNFKDRFIPPFQNSNYILGTDYYGRDVLTRTMLGFQYSLMMAGTVLSLVVAPGVILGLIAGYHKGTWVDTVIMRISDVFIAVPPLVLALGICSVLEPNIFNAMMAVSLMWWPWYARLTYNVSSALRNEYFVQAAEVMGASTLHIIFKEILPNCLGPILTKVTLDVGWVILIGSALSFVGLGAQPPTPDLGTMVATNAEKYMPDFWWTSIFPALGIVIIILGFNLLGDGVRDMFTE